MCITRSFLKNVPHLKGLQLKCLQLGRYPIIIIKVPSKFFPLERNPLTVSEVTSKLALLQRNVMNITSVPFNVPQLDEIRLTTPKLTRSPPRCPPNVPHLEGIHYEHHQGPLQMSSNWMIQSKSPEGALQIPRAQNNFQTVVRHVDQPKKCLFSQVSILIVKILGKKLIYPCVIFYLRMSLYFKIR